ncbi:Nucleoporin nup85 [Cichlidogyrus casuarinus]|uniref:Nuclear pore complex protein Nup85 n=1 Tax=Cichlidogyrus casuarinus TaxID=1844966 RepID=A0ABD2QHV5_9PLAT
MAACSQEILDFFNLNLDINEQAKLYLSSLGETYRCLELVWHIAEIMFISDSPKAYFAQDLLSWFAIQNTDPIEHAKEIANDNLNLLQDDSYWPTVVSLVCQGLTSEAIQLLECHPNANFDEFRLIRILLARMPTLTSNESIQELTDETASVLQVLGKILSGSEEVFHDPLLVALLGGKACWYFRFAARVFFVDQFATKDAMPRLIQNWLEMDSENLDQEDEASRTPLGEVTDILVEKAFQLDLLEFLQSAAENFTDWWFVAHFANLLKLSQPSLFPYTYTKKPVSSYVKSEPSVHPQASPQTQQIAGFSLADYYVISFAENISSIDSMVPMSLGYLHQIDKAVPHPLKLQLRARKVAILEHVHPNSVRTTHWLISLAKKYGMTESISVINRVSRVKSNEFAELLDCLRVEAAQIPNGIQQLEDSSLLDKILGRILELIAKSSNSSAFSDAVYPLNMRTKQENQHTRDYNEEQMRLLEILESTAAVLLNHFSNNQEISGETFSTRVAFYLGYAQFRAHLKEDLIAEAFESLVDLISLGEGSSAGTFDSGLGPSPYASLHMKLHLVSILKAIIIQPEVEISKDHAELLLAALTDIEMDLTSIRLNENNLMLSVEDSDSRRELMVNLEENILDIRFILVKKIALL